MSRPAVSVIMPTYRQAAFLPRAAGSLLAQTTHDWELVIVDDGSPDDTREAAGCLLHDPRVRYLRLARNRGLGAALNSGLALAAAPVIAYLPSDDLYDPGHLAALLDVLADPAVLMAVSGARGRRDGQPLQLVQVAHRAVPDRWTERAELESDDLDRLYWARLRARGGLRVTGRVTCTWTDHPGQRHKAIREAYDGGLNVFRSRYEVAAPLRFHSTDSGEVDEVALYERFRRRNMPPAADGLTILLVGELAYNPERVLALAERGHRLYGLWTRDGLGCNTVGPLPFGHVTDLPRDDWRRAARRVRPDVVYALLNWRAVPFCHEVLRALPGVPFVWHFKEAPQHSIRRGEWPLLAELVTRSAAQLYCSPEEREWFLAALPGAVDPGRAYVMDGDLPKADWFEGVPAGPGGDGEVHTVVLGRPLGLDAESVAALARRGVHVHLHGLVTAPGVKGAWASWLPRAVEAAPGWVHVHPHVDQRDWVRVLSRYDAGWLHRVRSANGGDLRVATWDDLNLPARIPPLMAAGVPLLQQRSPGCRVAADALIETTGIGLLYDDLDGLADRLRDAAAIRRARDAVAAHRSSFTFDAHADRLIGLFRRVCR